MFSISVNPSTVGVMPHLSFCSVSGSALCLALIFGNGSVHAISVEEYLGSESDEYDPECRDRNTYWVMKLGSGMRVTIFFMGIFRDWPKNQIGWRCESMLDRTKGVP